MDKKYPLLPRHVLAKVMTGLMAARRNNNIS
jgi:hypothetical protein